MTQDTHAALIMIDMQNGFINAESSLCVAGAAQTVPLCAQALHAARSQNIVVIHAIRSYKSDGSDVERCRYATWIQDRALSPSAAPVCSAEVPPELTPLSNETVIVKPRFSAFFGTQLADLLREQDVTTVILAGTTTPNCIRSTCYDAFSYDFDVVILEDCTSSRTDAVQAANIEDMRYLGATIMSCEEFAQGAALPPQ